MTTYHVELEIEVRDGVPLDLVLWLVHQLIQTSNVTSSLDPKIRIIKSWEPELPDL